MLRLVDLVAITTKRVPRCSQPRGSTMSPSGSLWHFGVRGESVGGGCAVRQSVSPHQSSGRGVEGGECQSISSSTYCKPTTLFLTYTSNFRSENLPALPDALTVDAEVPPGARRRYRGPSRLGAAGHPLGSYRYEVKQPQHEDLLKKSSGADFPDPIGGGNVPADARFTPRTPSGGRGEEWENRLRGPRPHIK